LDHFYSFLSQKALLIPAGSYVQKSMYDMARGFNTKKKKKLTNNYWLISDAGKQPKD